MIPIGRNPVVIRLLCVDDDPLVRTYLATRLALEPDIEVVGVVETAGEALSFVRAGQPVDVLLVDYCLQGADGLQLVGAVTGGANAEAGSGPRVLLCTGLGTGTLDLQARRLGACGIVAKDRLNADLVPAVRAAARGDAWFN
jgi:DNA-binding NarL/FixJ family response regulator